MIAFVAALQSHILSEISRKESEILGLVLLSYVPNWQEITVNWSELAHSNGLVSTQVVKGREVSGCRVDLLVKKFVRRQPHNVLPVQCRLGRVLFFAALIRVNWTLIDGYFVLHNRTGTLYINKYDK